MIQSNDGAGIYCSDGSLHSYPLEPQRARAAASGLARQLTSQQSPPSQPHSAALAAPLLHLPFPNTKGWALHTAFGMGPTVGLSVGFSVGRVVGAHVGVNVGLLDGVIVGDTEAIIAGEGTGKYVDNTIGCREGQIVGEVERSTPCDAVGAAVRILEGATVDCNCDGSVHSYPLEPQRARAAASGLARQLTSQQSPPSQPHSAALAAPLLHLPLPNTKGWALHTAFWGGITVGDLVCDIVDFTLGAAVGLPNGATVGVGVDTSVGLAVGDEVG
jgi:hypothetical protein